MPRPPSIILVLTDDHGAWALGAYGNREVRSPALDRLAAEGVRFANAFTPCPVCSPARASVVVSAPHCLTPPEQFPINDRRAHPRFCASVADVSDPACR